MWRQNLRLSGRLGPGRRGGGCVCHWLHDQASGAVGLINGSRCPGGGREGLRCKDVRDDALPADGVHRLWLYGIWGKAGRAWRASCGVEAGLCGLISLLPFPLFLYLRTR